MKKRPDREKRCASPAQDRLDVLHLTKEGLTQNRRSGDRCIPAENSGRPNVPFEPSENTQNESGYERQPLAPTPRIFSSKYELGGAGSGRLQQRRRWASRPSANPVWTRVRRVVVLLGGRRSAMLDGGRRLPCRMGGVCARPSA